MGALGEKPHDAIADLHDYFDEENLLPSWQRRLDVVNCAGISECVLEGNTYICPATGGAYNHNRCKYFGMYRNKRIEQIAVIEAVVDLLSEDEHNLKWKNVSTEDDTLVKLAPEKQTVWRPGKYPLRVFLLGELHETNFHKDSKGGMMGSKQYFDVSSLKAENDAELAEKLRDLPWSSLAS